MGGNAFVYGTLMAPEVLKALINRVPPMKPAVIKGFRRYRVKGQVFPAIVPDLSDSQVDGQILLGLTDKELHIFDVYESEEYHKQDVTPALEDGTQLEALVYVWNEQFRPLIEYEAWDYSQFMENDLEQYLVNTKEFTKELQDLLSST